ncbi:hypothetical protein PFISCL1PPCAC_11102, partial [Pristionchus fissidentatus]
MDENGVVPAEIAPSEEELARIINQNAELIRELEKRNDRMERLLMDNAKLVQDKERVDSEAFTWRKRSRNVMIAAICLVIFWQQKRAQLELEMEETKRKSVLTTLLSISLAVAVIVWFFVTARRKNDHDSQNGPSFHDNQAILRDAVQLHDQVIQTNEVNER